MAMATETLRAFNGNFNGNGNHGIANGNFNGNGNRGVGNGNNNGNFNR